MAVGYNRKVLPETGIEKLNTGEKTVCPRCHRLVIRWNSIWNKCDQVFWTMYILLGVLHYNILKMGSIFIFSWKWESLPDECPSSTFPLEDENRSSFQNIVMCSKCQFSLL